MREQKYTKEPTSNTALQAGIPFGVLMGGLFVFGIGLSGGIAVGLVSGVLFGATIGRFVDDTRQKMQPPESTFEGAPILHHGPANHVQGAESRGGWLILTTQQLLFRSHGKNIQNNELRLFVKELRAARAKRTLGIIPNGLRVDKRDNGHEFFVVNNNSLWEARLAAAIEVASS